jgi:hypothetical protein
MCNYITLANKMLMQQTLTSAGIRKGRKPANLRGYMNSEGRRKHSFDAEGKANEILARVERTSLKKGAFINKCIELAEQQAFDALQREVDAARTPAEPPKGRKDKEGKKP